MGSRLPEIDGAARRNQVEKDKAAGVDITKLGTSEIVVQTTDDLDELAAQGLAGKC